MLLMLTGGCILYLVLMGCGLMGPVGLWWVLVGVSGW
jgi:hypothetical protein